MIRIKLAKSAKLCAIQYLYLAIYTKFTKQNYSVFRLKLAELPEFAIRSIQTILTKFFK